MANTNRSIPLTKKAIDGLPPHDPAGTQSTATEYSTGEPGLHICVNMRGNKRWLFRYRLYGRKKAVAIGPYPAIEPPLAKQMANEMQRNLALGEPVVSPRAQQKQQKTFGEFAREYLEHAKQTKKSWKDDYNKLTNQIIPKWGEVPLTCLTPKEIQGYLNQVKARTSGTNANRHYAVLNVVYNLAVKWGEIDPGKNPMPGVSKFRDNPGRTRYLSMEECKRFLAALEEVPGQLAACALRLLLFTGCRAGEVLKSKWEDVSADSRTMLLPDTKNGKSRVVYLNPLSLGEIEKLKDFRKPGNPYLFPGSSDDKPLGTVRKTFEHALKLAGLQGTDVVIHTLRHTHASLLANLGESLETIKVSLGHSSVKMTERYAHISGSKTKDASDQLAEHLKEAMDK
jgi:integrase